MDEGSFGPASAQDAQPRVARQRGWTAPSDGYLHPGVFSRIPTVRNAQELLDTAFRHASRITVMDRDAVGRAKATETARIRSVQNSLATILRKWVGKWPSFDRLSPFYQDLAALLVDMDRVRKALGALDWAAGRIDELGDEAVRKVKAARSPEDAKEAKRGAYGRIASVLKQVDRQLTVLADARESIRRLPTIDPNVPTLVVAGYPNVGKSSLLHRVSTAAPEVANYPFTTKGIVVGVFDRNRIRYQLVDTPGLLDRELTERNNIELHAILALRHLGDAIIFLLDPSEHCGYSMEDQLRLLQETRRTFPDVPVVVAENKVDIARTEVPGRHRISTETGEGIDELIDDAIEAAREGREAPAYQ